jgi:hypothetical protein
LIVSTAQKRDKDTLEWVELEGRAVFKKLEKGRQRAHDPHKVSRNKTHVVRVKGPKLQRSVVDKGNSNGKFGTSDKWVKTDDKKTSRCWAALSYTPLDLHLFT